MYDSCWPPAECWISLCVAWPYCESSVASFTVCFIHDPEVNTINKSLKKTFLKQFSCRRKTLFTLLLCEWWDCKHQQGSGELLILETWFDLIYDFTITPKSQPQSERGMSCMQHMEYSQKKFPCLQSCPSYGKLSPPSQAQEKISLLETWVGFPDVYTKCTSHNICSISI